MLSHMNGKLVNVTIEGQIKEGDSGFLTIPGILIGSDDRFVYLGKEDLTVNTAISLNKVVAIEELEDSDEEIAPAGTSYN